MTYEPQHIDISDPGARSRLQVEALRRNDLATLQRIADVDPLAGRRIVRRLVDAGASWSISLRVQEMTWMMRENEGLRGAGDDREAVYSGDVAIERLGSGPAPWSFHTPIRVASAWGVQARFHWLLDCAARVLPAWRCVMGEGDDRAAQVIDTLRHAIGGTGALDEGDIEARMKSSAFRLSELIHNEIDALPGALIATSSPADRLRVFFSRLRFRGCLRDADRDARSLVILDGAPVDRWPALGIGITEASVAAERAWQADRALQYLLGEVLP